MGIIQDHDAQFMLLAGFIIAIGLVITTVLLNSIIFEGNMAVEGGDELSKDEIVNMMQITEDEIKATYRNATALGGTKDNITTNFSRQMNNFSAYLPRIFALHGGAVNVSWNIENWNNTRYANFTDNGMAIGAGNWTVVEGVDVSSVDIFKFWNVSIFASKSFKVEARNSAGTIIWSVEFNNSGYNVTNLTNSNHGSPLPAELDLNLSQYYFRQSASPGPVSINIIEGNNAFGKYKIQGIANGRIFYRERHYILNATPTFSTSRMKANITIPVSVPW